jgi:hypothetical protein
MVESAHRSHRQGNLYRSRPSGGAG